MMEDEGKRQQFDDQELETEMRADQEQNRKGTYKSHHLGCEKQKIG